MTLNELCDLIQFYCHAGYAQDEVEIYDSDEGVYLGLENIKLDRDHDREVISIEMEHRRK